MSADTQNIENLSPRQIVGQLDRYIIGQHEAKRAVAIALRNRWRRLKVMGEMKEEITPKNIIMIGPTGVGKTEIARRLAKLAQAPFYKVEASKFTEVGYVGKDVESMIRDLVEISVNIVREQERELVKAKAKEQAEERLLDILLPKKRVKQTPDQPAQGDSVIISSTQMIADEDSRTREKMRHMLQTGLLNDRKVDLETGGTRPPGMGTGIPMIEVVSSTGSMDDMANNLKDIMSNFLPRGKKRRRVTVPEAIEILTNEETAKLIDMEGVTKRAVDLVENNGIVFIDEIDKIASSGQSHGGPDVSREGVQRDILPIVEGSTISTKYGFIKTDHILFIASGAFHVSKPSDLIPELQGRFPIRVELQPLKKEDFIRILTEPKNALAKQYQALMKTENIHLEFASDAIAEIAAMAELVNDQVENIGARRLYTIMEKVMDELSFDASERQGGEFVVTGAYVKKCLETVTKSQDLSRYIL